MIVCNLHQILYLVICISFKYRIQNENTVGMKNFSSYFDYYHCTSTKCTDVTFFESDTIKLSQKHTNVILMPPWIYHGSHVHSYLHGHEVLTICLLNWFGQVSGLLILMSGWMLYFLKDDGNLIKWPLVPILSASSTGLNNGQGPCESVLGLDIFMLFSFSQTYWYAYVFIASHRLL